MKIKMIRRGSITLAFLLCSLAAVAQTSSAQYTCSHIGFGQYASNNVAHSTGCGEAFSNCVESFNSEYRKYTDCIGSGGGCWDIGRPAWIEGPDRCPTEGTDLEAFFKGHDPDSWVGGVNYCTCIYSCQSKKPEQAIRNRCDVDFKECCSKLIEMKPEEEKETTVKEIKPEAGFDVKISPESFRIVADGMSEQQITAEVTGTNLSGKNIKLRAELSRTNSLAPGKLVNTAVSGNKLSTFYVAPQIGEKQLKDSRDEVADYIYIYATVDGKEIYKTAQAVLTLQAGDYTLLFERDGFTSKTVEHSFDKGSLSGQIFITDRQGQKHLINGVKITLKSPRSDELDVVRDSVDGQYFFEKMGGTGEENLDVEMAVSDDVKGDLDNMVQYSKNAKKFGDFDAIRAIDEFYKPLAEAKGAEINQVLTGIKAAGYTLYYLDYYDKIAIESLENFVEFTQNIFKDALSLFLSYVNLTNGIWSYKEGNISWKNPVGLVISKMTEFNDKDAFVKAAARKFFRGVIDTIIGMISKYPRAAEINKIWIGALEGDVYNRMVGAYDESDLAKRINRKIRDSLHAFYIEDVSKMMKKFKLDLKNPPQDFADNLQKARTVFEANAKKHEERNVKQYSWTMGAAWATMLHDVGKGTIQAILVLKAGPQLADKINKVLDKISLGLNLLKGAISTNASYEWMMLYYEDELDLVRTLNLIYRGKDSEYLAGAGDSLPAVEVANIQSGGWQIVPSASALVPKMDYPLALDSLMAAVKGGDEKKVESAVTTMNSIRESYDREQEDIRTRIGANLVPELAAESKAIIQQQGELALNDSLIQLKLLALSLDQSDVTLTSLESSVKELKTSYGQVNSGIGPYLEKASKIKEENRKREGAGQAEDTPLAVKPVSASTPAVPQLHVFIIGIAALLLVFIVLILATRKIVLSIILGLLAGLLGFGVTYLLQIYPPGAAPYATQQSASAEQSAAVSDPKNIPALPAPPEAKVISETSNEAATESSAAITEKPATEDPPAEMITSPAEAVASPTEEQKVAADQNDASQLLAAKKHSFNFILPEIFGLQTTVNEDDYLYLEGRNINFTIDAGEGGQFENLIKPGYTLSDYVEYKEYFSLAGRKSIQEITIGETPAFLTEYENPASVVLYWKTPENYLVQFTMDGAKVVSERKTIDQVIDSISLPGGGAEEECSHPNGDVEYWWNEAEQAERDCFIKKYGFTPDVN